MKKLKSIWHKFYSKHAGYYIKIRAYQRVDGRFSWILQEVKTDWVVNSESIPTATFDTPENAVNAAKAYFHAMWFARQPKGWAFVKLVLQHWRNNMTARIQRNKP